MGFALRLTLNEEKIRDKEAIDILLEIPRSQWTGFIVDAILDYSNGTKPTDADAMVDIVRRVIRSELQNISVSPQSESGNIEHTNEELPDFISEVFENFQGMT